MGYRLVEWRDPPIRPGLHNSAFHGSEDEDGQAVKIASGWKAFARLFQEAADRSGPRREVGGDALMRGQVFSLDFESQTPDGASVPVTGGQKTLAVSLKNGEDARQRIGECRFSRLDDDWMQPFLVTVQESQQQGFLTIEEVIEAAAIGLRPVEQLRHTRGREALFPK